MRMRRWVAVLCALWLSATAQPAFALTGNCWGDLKSALDKGGFTAPTSCDDFYSLDIRYVGRTTGVRNYRIYLAFWSLKSVTGGPGHGGGRVLIFDDRRRYLGQYVVNDSFDRAWVKGDSVRFKYPAKWGNVLRLSGDRPPSTAWFLGDTSYFYK